MQLWFLITAGIGLCYLLFAKRRFDCFSVAFLSACVYFIPGFVGYTLMPTKTSMEEAVDLEIETYLVMIVVLIAILMGAVLLDLASEKKPPALRLNDTAHTGTWAVMIAILGYVLLIASVGDVLFDDKSILIKNLNRWHVIGATAAPLGAVLCFVYRLRFPFVIAMLILLFDVYIGFRISLAVAMIAIFTLWLGRDGQQRLALNNWRAGILGSIVVCFLFVYKQLYEVVKLGMWDFIVERLQDPDLYVAAIGMSEPFTIQVILNEVIVQRFVVGMGHLREVLYQFALFSPELGVKPVSFNDLFQSSLFPTDMEYGMANNIWAEMWSTGGWPLLLVFVTIFVLMLVVGSYLIRSSDKTVSSVAALTFSYWAFYIHRNDLAFQINLEKRVIILAAICMLLSKLQHLARLVAMSTKEKDDLSFAGNVPSLNGESSSHH